MLVLWSAILAYVFLKRKVNMQMVFAAVSGKRSESKKTAHATDSFSHLVDADRSAIESVETYARMNKVLLSSDASVKLVKLSRLNKVDAKTLINKMSTNEWTTVGESDLEKYL